MIIEKYKQLAKASKNHKNLTATTAEKQHDQMTVFDLKQFLTFRHNFHQSQPQRYSTHNSSIIGVLCVIFLTSLLCCVDAVGYSYTRFIGPVAGPEHRIYVNDAGNPHSGGGAHASRLDYVAKPEYEFSYGVEDAEAHILHNRNEMRDGDDVKGVYSVVDPDGTLRVVKYTADEANGFQAEVITNGVSSLHGGQQQHHHGVTNNNHYQPHLSNHPPNVYTPNLEQHINHYYPQNLYPTLPPAGPPTPIIYQYNTNDNYNNNNNNNDDVDNGNDYNEDYQPQYEVHEKQNDKDHKDKNNNDDDTDNQHDDDDDVGANDDDVVDYDHNNDDDGGHKKKGKPNKTNKKKKGHSDESNDDNSDDEDDGDYDDSEELQDYEEAARSNEANGENDDYY